MAQQGWVAFKKTPGVGTLMRSERPISGSIPVTSVIFASVQRAFLGAHTIWLAESVSDFFDDALRDEHTVAFAKWDIIVFSSNPLAVHEVPGSSSHRASECHTGSSSCG